MDDFSAVFGLGVKTDESAFKTKNPEPENPVKKTTSHRPMIENLEGRELMSASYNVQPNGVLVVNCQDTNDYIQVRQTATQVILNNRVAFSANAITGVIVNANGGNDTVDLTGLNKPASVFGGAGDDRIIGGNGNDLLRGGDGNDVIFGGPGNDEIHGDAGNDRLFGNDGYDYIFGEDGNDFMDDCNRSMHEYYNGGSGADFVADYWAVNGTTVNDIVQGQSGTCAFLSGLAAGCNAGIDYTNWISYRGYDNNGVGIYDVSLWNPGTGQWMKVPVQFDGSVNMYDTGTAVDRPGRVAELESWVLLMQRAYINAGGSTNPTIALAAATGGYVNHYSLWDSNAQNIVINALNNRRPMTVAIGSNSFFGITGHALAIVAGRMNNGSLEVCLHNPWGMDTQATNGQPYALSGDANDGLFWVSWSTLQNYFDGGIWVR